MTKASYKTWPPSRKFYLQTDLEQWTQTTYSNVLKAQTNYTLFTVYTSRTIATDGHLTESEPSQLLHQLLELFASITTMYYTWTTVHLWATRKFQNKIICPHSSLIGSRLEVLAAVVSHLYRAVSKPEKISGVSIKDAGAGSLSKSVSKLTARVFKLSWFFAFMEGIL